MGFKTHTEGGSWTGGGTEVPNCNLADRNAITAAFDFMLNDRTRGVPAIRAFGGLEGLANCLAGKTLSSVEVDCRGSGCTAGIFGRAPRNGSSINMCPPSLPTQGVQADTDVTLIHELVHSCGGAEIDAWSIENHFYAGHGTINPSTTTFVSETSDIGGGLRASTFVVWERSTGAVFVKVESGGSWNSGPTVSRGNELHASLRSLYRV
jgi:hypothetical protein